MKCLCFSVNIACTQTTCEQESIIRTLKEVDAVVVVVAKLPLQQLSLGDTIVGKKMRKRNCSIHEQITSTNIFMTKRKMNRNYNTSNR